MYKTKIYLFLNIIFFRRLFYSTPGLVEEIRIHNRNSRSIMRIRFGAVLESRAIAIFIIIIFHHRVTRK